MTDTDILQAASLQVLLELPAVGGQILKAMEAARLDERTKVAAKLKQTAIEKLNALREGRPEWWL